MRRRSAVVLFAGLVLTALLAACGGYTNEAAAVPATAEVSARQPSSPELLYVLKRKPKSDSPYVAVVNLHDLSEKPTPIYTIRPNGAGMYNLMAVDARDNFFVSDDLPAASKILMFAAGQNKPSGACTFSGTLSNIMVSGSTLYVAGPIPNDTIEEYAEPFAHGTCGKPLKTLTDGIAQRMGSKGLCALAIDSNGNLFDTYEGEKGFTIDVFPAGRSHAKTFENIGGYQSCPNAVMDRSNDLVETLSNFEGSPNFSLGVFAKESKTPDLYYPSGGSPWLGLAFGEKQTELFAMHYDYIKSAILILAYDPNSGVIGKEKAMYSDSELLDESFAVYSK